MGGCVTSTNNRELRTVEPTTITPPIIFADVRLTLFNNTVINFRMQRNITGEAIRRLIFERHCVELRPQLMIITRNEVWNDNQQLDHSNIQITQRIAQIWQLGLGLNVDQNRADEVSGETGVVQLQCTHYISRGGFIGVLDYQLDVLRQNQIHCPFLLPDGNICRRTIDKKYHQLFAGYTQTQWRPITDKFSINYGIIYTSRCPNPNCREAILRGRLTEKRITCPLCRTVFCFQCTEPWNGRGDDCQSQRCFAIGRLIANAPWDRIFMMYRRPNNNATFQVKVPNLRACPRCRALVMNTANCKHTRCPCGTSFCFVCLSIYQNRWICGEPYEYCSSGVAPNQILNIAT